MDIPAFKFTIIPMAYQKPGAFQIVAFAPIP